ncbi:MAG: DUF5329 domain-containing protein [Gammaproteobacteria bacterium]|nr:DUF5329 domain-containing protein [Gammaproteobacteria bacterium]
MMKSAIFSGFMMLLPGFGMAFANADMMQGEIDHLLGFVEDTRCRYERNGNSYSGVQAAEHIRKKYRYFRDEINSTEKFIDLSATKSTMSGQYYMVYCDDLPAQRSQEWLLEELQKLRGKK